MTDLRSALVPQVARLADDVAVGRHGDPYAAVVVLVYPDREPAVLMVSGGHPAYDLTLLTKSDGSGTPFPVAEFQEAIDAGYDAAFGLRVGQSRSDLHEEPGEAIGAWIEHGWSRRRLLPITAALSAADDEAARPAECERCGRRFTERGLPMHLSRSRWCKT